MASPSSGKIRVRFAPSPTGFLHVGGVRTALYNWLFARGRHGTMILRIEDTDVERSTEEAVTAILEGLRWLNLDWDEGPDVGGPVGPYRQLERYALYREHAKRLVREGAAYPCTCLPQELAARRDAARAGQRAARHLCSCRTSGPLPGRRQAVRFHVTATGRIGWDDLVQGRVEVAADEIEDFIIVRSDEGETPVYNFAATVDDALMGITHVVRGADHIPNTPKQILLYEALGYPVPIFGHIPLVLGADREKLSKRHGDVALQAYREQGYLPEAMVNYLVRLGWSHGDQEVFTREELITLFRIERVGASPGIFDRAKLDWLNALYLRQSAPEALADMLTPFWPAAGVDPGAVTARGRAWLVRAIPLFVERAKTLLEMARSMAFLFAPPATRDPKAEARFLTPDRLVLLGEVRRVLAEAPDFEAATLEGLLRRLGVERGVKLVDLAQPVRVALTGTTASPPLFPILALLGRKVVLERLDGVLARG
jgi:glutamyl-tRNA synthetase